MQVHHVESRQCSSSYATHGTSPNVNRAYRSLNRLPRNAQGRGRRVSTTAVEHVSSTSNLSSFERLSGLFQRLPWSSAKPAPPRGSSPPRAITTAEPDLADVSETVILPQRRTNSYSHPRGERSAGGHAHPVLELIKQRVREGSKPGSRKDGLKLGLVVEGGGMRGIVTGAMLMGILNMGMRDAFDAVYGASAGAINSTYFLSGQRQGLDLYTDHLAIGNKFLDVSFRRYWSGEPIMNLDYLLDVLMHEVTPLDWDAVLDSPIPLKVVASSLTTLQAEAFSNFADKGDLIECLKASANVPRIVGPPREHRGHQLVDAAVFEPIPVKAALRDGCTHVLTLCSRAPDEGPAWGKLVKKVVHNAVKYTVLNPPYMREAWRVEPRHTYHLGQPLDDLMMNLHLQGSRVLLDLSQDNYSGSSSLSNSSSGSPTSSISGSDSDDTAAGVVPSGISGRGKAKGVGAADGVCGHVYPVYAGPSVSFAPICTDVTALNVGRSEGYAAVQKVLLPIKASLQ